MSKLDGVFVGALAGAAFGAIVTSAAPKRSYFRRSPWTGRRKAKNVELEWAALGALMGAIVT